MSASSAGSWFRWMPGGGRNVGLLVTLVLGLLLISLFSPQYLSLDNALVVALQISFVGIASLGTASLIIGGNIDLSIGSQYALCAVSAAMLAKELPAPLSWIAGILLGAVLGLINGLMVWRINISPIIITLGTLTIYRGIALRITNGFGVRGVPKSFSWFGQARFLRYPSAYLGPGRAGAPRAFDLALHHAGPAFVCIWRKQASSGSCWNQRQAPGAFQLCPQRRAGRDICSVGRQPLWNGSSHLRKWL